MKANIGKFGVALVLTGCVLLPAFAASHPKRHSERVRVYKHNTFGKGAWVGHGVKAGISQAKGSPREWGGGLSGFGKRFGSSVGTGVLNSSIAMGVGAIRHEDFRYHRSHKKGTFPRIGYAVKHTFITPKTNRPGKKTIASGRLSGAFGSGLISQVWAPAGTVGAGLSTGGIALGAAVATNVTREFLPERKHKRSRVAHHRSGKSRAG